MASGASRPQYSPRPYTTTAAHGIKRSHAIMEVSHRSSISPLFEPLDEPPHFEPPPPHRSHLILPPLVPNIRSPPQNMAPPLQRRGLDFRRPVTSGTAQSRGGEVVDLTNSDEEAEEESEQLEDDAEGEWRVSAHAGTRQRLPNFNHPIIDLSSDSSPADRAESTRRTPEHSRRTPYLEGRRPPSLVREGSSDVMFMQIRQRQDERRAREEREQQNQDHGSPSPVRQRHRMVASLGPEPDEPIDLTDDDDLIFVSERRNPNARPRPPRPDSATATLDALAAMNSRRADRSMRHRTRLDDIEILLNGDGNSRPQTNWLRQQVMRNAGAVGDAMYAIAGYIPHLIAGNEESRQTHAFIAPGRMDYGGAAFNLGIPEPPRRPPSPQYDPPPKPAPGFTRSPAEDEEVVCPNCGDELAMGGTDEKRSVWIVKGCGHVYCGQCMLNRGRKANGKGKQKDDGTAHSQTKPFKECVVEDCSQKVSSRAQVIQLFL